MHGCIQTRIQYIPIFKPQILTKQMYDKCMTFYLFITEFFVTYNIGGTKELLVLLWLSGDS